MNALEMNDIQYEPGESKRLNRHVVVHYLDPYLGDIYSGKNVVKSFSDEDDNISGCVTGDLVTWVKNHIGEEFLSEYMGEMVVEAMFPSECWIDEGDTFECLTKSPFLVNNKVTFNIKEYRIYGWREWLGCLED